MCRGQMAGERLITARWFGLIGSEPLNWGQLLRGQNDHQFRDYAIRLPAGNPPTLIIPLLLVAHFVLLSQASSYLFFLSFLLFFILLFVLPLTPEAAELLMGCGASEIFPAVDLFVGLVLRCLLVLGCVWVWVDAGMHLCLPNQIFCCISARINMCLL